MRNPASRILGVTMMAAVLLGAATTWGDASPQDKAVARSMFDQGRKLASQDKHAEACPKFEQSQRLDPGQGMMFNLADCYAQVGRTASAWALFLEVAAVARASGQPDRERVARQRATELEPKLAHIVLSVPEASRIAGLEIRRDGALVGSGQWGTDAPVDPGDHTLEATAPGRSKWTQTVLAASGGPSVTVSIPLLELVNAAPVPAAMGSSPAVRPSAAPPRSNAPTPRPSAAAAPPGAISRPGPSAALSTAATSSQVPDQESKPGAGQRTVGLWIGGLGVVGLGVGAFLGLDANSKLSDSKKTCAGKLSLSDTINDVVIESYCNPPID